MWEFLDRLFGGGFMPHGHCYLWSPSMVWTQVTSNLLIGLAYLSISATLGYLVWRVRLPFSWVYIAFGTFILACGLTHFFDVVTVWHPIYWADAGVRVLTAVASVGTAVLVVPLVPKVVEISKLSDVARERGEKLQEAIAELRGALDETSRYRLLVESAKDATFILDKGGRVVTWNAAAERLEKYAAGEIIGKHFSSFYLSEDKRAGKPERELEVATAGGLFEEEAWRLRKDGSRFWASVTITAMRDEKGEVVGFAQVIRDLTERIRNEERLRALAAENAVLTEKARVQEFQERFLAILGHDLRNPLAAIDMGVGIFRQRFAGDPKLSRVLVRMDSSAQRMSRMIEQILDLTRSRLSGGLKVSPAPMDLRTTLAKIVDEERAANPSRTLRLACPDLPGVWDSDRLEQVFSNLVSNALQHGSPESPVTIEAREEAGVISVSVHNEGAPIPEELQAKLFDPFRRGERDSRTSRTAGLGLGLYISREIVTAHGGDIQVRSSGAEGTTFRITLPRVSAEVLSP
jgi:PAS domain S-box-containing protein